MIFNNNEDVWKIIDLIINETIAINQENGKQFSISESIVAQLPFFACSKAIYSEESQKEIERYYYCKEFGVQPYPGSFEEQPASWIENVFIIKSAINKREKKAYAKANNNS